MLLQRQFQQDAKGGDTPRNVHAAEGGGDAGSETAVSETPVSEAPAQPSGPRIVINPKVFTDKRDALCVAFNEAIRLVCEENGFEPVSEPTEAQRKFFADTAYANDELQLRRTILARIATLDTSVKDPTDEQLEETAEMLEMVMEVGAPQNEWEQQAVQRLHDVVVKAREASAAGGSGAPQPEPEPEPEPPEETGSAQADEGGGVPSLAERYPEPLLDEDRERHRAAVQRLARWEIANGPEAPKPYGILRDEAALAEIADRNDAYMKRLEEYWERRAGTGLAVKANDGTGVTDPVWAPKRLARQVTSGFTGFLSGAASALDGVLGSPERQIRERTVFRNDGWLSRATDALALHSEQRKLTFPTAGETVVRTAAEYLPWLHPAALYAIPAAAYGSVTASTRRSYDATWASTGTDPEAAGWWMKPELRGGLAAAATAVPVGKIARNTWGSVSAKAFPSASRAVVPYRPGWAYLQAARRAWQSAHGHPFFDAAAQLGAMEAAGRLTMPTSPLQPEE